MQLAASPEQVNAVRRILEPDVKWQEFGMPGLDWNKQIWEETYEWPDAGEEWSRVWGGSEAQWFGSLYPRLHRFLPADRILEIAPGYGRWTRFLIPACSSYLGVDLSSRCVDVCRSRFKEASQARFFENDGLSLACIPDASCDLIFSFDSLVHAELDVLQSYIPQMIKKLSANGVAFIHHSNLQDDGLPKDIYTHFRAGSVSRSIVADLIVQTGGGVIIQEAINWVGSTSPIDCLTLFGRADRGRQGEPVYLFNTRFMEEAQSIASFQSPYSGLA
jgi:SAM-dependent methyltransferase